MVGPASSTAAIGASPAKRMWRLPGRSSVVAPVAASRDGQTLNVSGGLSVGMVG